MTCFHPLKAYRSAQVGERGKRLITFNPVKAYVEGSSFRLPCGQCTGCRADRAFQWAMRFGHEASLYESNLFCSLTYDNQHVPQDFSVKLRDYQLVVKRMRKHFGRSIRFGGCGEYGDTTGRPHYHFGFFNLDFADKKRVGERGGYPIYRSETLSALWPFGSHEIGKLTHESGGYIARYVFKKMTGERADSHYLRVSPVDGELHRVSPEFFTMSRRPGLGMAWFERFRSDAFPMETVIRDGEKIMRPAGGADFLIVDGRKVRPPQFYLSKLDQGSQEAIKRARKARSVQPAQRANSTPERLAVREEVHLARLQRLVREL